MDDFTLYFCDRKMNITGAASTLRPSEIMIDRDVEIENVEVASALFEADLVYSKDTNIDEKVDVGSYVLFQNEDGQGRFYTVIDTSKDTKNRTLEIYAEDAGLDLINEDCEPYEANQAYPIAHYIERFSFDSGFEIGINELGNSLNRKLKWEGTESAVKRIRSVATQFDHAEINFSFKIEGMTVIKKYINIYKKIGQDVGTRLSLNRDINNIVRTKSIANLATAYNVTGGIPEGQDQKPITLEGYRYDDGRFYVSGRYLKDRVSLAIWSRYVSPNEFGTDEGHLVKPFSYDTLSQSELCNRAVSALAKASEVEMNFEVDIARLPANCRVGDTVYIVDNDDELYLQARILKLERSRSDGESVATLGEYLIKESGINDRLQALAEKINKLGEIVKIVGQEIRYQSHSSGTDLPTGVWLENLPAVPEGYFLWTRNRILFSDGTDATSYSVAKQGVSGKPGEDGKPGNDGKPGADGKTSYFYTAYANSEDGTVGFSITDATNKSYLGMYSSFDSNQSTDPKRYTWTERAVYIKAELEKEIASVPRVFNQYAAPIDPKKNDLWWQSEQSDSQKIIGYFKYNGTSWEGMTFEQTILNILRLDAVEINGSVIVGSSFVNYWNKLATNGREGVMRIENGVLRSDYTMLNGGSGFLLFDEANLQMRTFDSSGSVVSNLITSPQQIQLAAKDPYTGTQYIGAIKAEALHNFGWKALELDSGWVTAENNPPMYKKTVNLDGSITIKWRGQLTTKSGKITSAISGVWPSTNIPVEARSDVTEFYLAPTSEPNVAVRLAMLSDGRFQLWTKIVVDYVALGGFTYDKV